MASFLSTPTNCNMGSLLAWASAHRSPARFHLHHASPPSPPPQAAPTILEILAADYGLKARNASGIRGEDLDDWPCVTDPSDLDLLRSYLRRLALRQSLDPSALELLTAGLSTASAALSLFPAGRTLLGLGDPRLPYTLFERSPIRADSQVDLLPLQLTGDPRLPSARDYAWTDLLLIGTDPNYAYLDPSHGLLPITVLNPSREEERTRWALHSLCQATIEALAIQPPRLRRLPRGRTPQPPLEAPLVCAAIPPPPSLTPPLGPPPPPTMTGSDAPPAPNMPAATVPPLKPLHTGLPPSSPWTRSRPSPTYGTLWSSLQCGPNHVALAGYTTSLPPNLRVGTLNTNGLTSPKLTEILWYMRLEQLDVFFLIDTRAPLRAGKVLSRQARDFLGPGSVAQISPARPAYDSEATARHALVGGQLLLVAPTWGCSLKSSRKDPTGLGVLTEAVLGCAGADILLLGTYFPSHPARARVLRWPAISSGINSSSGSTNSTSGTVHHNTCRTSSHSKRSGTVAGALPIPPP